jgi:Asp-tRNA(Asn)/Glu-tRNA(Gln) amidotransferase B subunit
MRLDEITKAEFVDGMKDPAIAELKKMSKEIKALSRIDKLTYSIKTYNHPDRGTLRKAEVMWDARYVPDVDLVPVRLDTDIGSHYKHNLEHWRLVGWTSENNTMTYELEERP